MKEIMLHGGADDAYDRSVIFARRLAESFGARLHIVYTIDDPVGWVEEQNIDLAILQAPLSNPRSVEIGRSLVDHGRCAVLVLR